MNTAHAYDKNGYLTLTNGLTSLVFRLYPNCAAVGRTDGIQPEAVIYLNKEKYEIGGSENSPFKFTDYTLQPIRKKQNRHIIGLEASFYYINPDIPGVSVVVIYKFYDNIAEYKKQLTLFNYTKNILLFSP